VVADAAVNTCADVDDTKSLLMVAFRSIDAGCLFMLVCQLTTLSSSRPRCNVNTSMGVRGRPRFKRPCNVELRKDEAKLTSTGHNVRGHASCRELHRGSALMTIRPRTFSRTASFSVLGLALVPYHNIRVLCHRRYASAYDASLFGRCDGLLLSLSRIVEFAIVGLSLTDWRTRVDLSVCLRPHHGWPPHTAR
jgi:hypothetical protein